MRQRQKHVKDEKHMDRKPRLPIDEHPTMMCLLGSECLQSELGPYFGEGQERPIGPTIHYPDPRDQHIPSGRDLRTRTRVFQHGRFQSDSFHSMRIAQRPTSRDEKQPRSYSVSDSSPS